MGTNTPVLRAILRLLNSSKFWALLFPALLSLGLAVPAEVQALLIFLAGMTYAVTTAMEDMATKRGATIAPAVWTTSNWSESTYDDELEELDSGGGGQ